MPATFDPAGHPALRGLDEQLPRLAGSAFSAGQSIFRSGGVQGRAVTPSLASSMIQGSAAAPYRVTLAFSAETPKPGCTCPAFRRNPWCKHVVALALALLSQGETFEVVEAPPEVSQPAPRARRGARIQRADDSTMRATGLEAVDRLLAGLADGGLRSMGEDKQVLLGSASELVRGLKLRRLASLLQALARGAADDNLDERRFGEVLAEIALVRRTVGASLEGRVQLDGGLDEELMGKVWQPRDLETVRDLELVQVAFTQTGEGEFQIQTAYLADPRDGQLYIERQILPYGVRPARSAPAPNHELRLLVTEAGLYPGPPPRRIKLVQTTAAPLRGSDFARVLQRALRSVAELRTRLVAHRSVPFRIGEPVVLFVPRQLLTHAETPGALDSAGFFVELRWPDARSSSWTQDLSERWPDNAPVGICGVLEDVGPGLRLNVLSAVSPAFRSAAGPIYA